MEKEIHKISVRIGGMSYSLVSGESEAYTRQIATRADEMIRRVSMSSPHLSQQMTTVLALVNAIDELTRQATQQALAEQQRDAAELKTAELRTELARARELNWEMKKEILRLSALGHDQEHQPASPSALAGSTVHAGPDALEPAAAPAHAAVAEALAARSSQSGLDSSAIPEAAAAPTDHASLAGYAPAADHAPKAGHASSADHAPTATHTPPANHESPAGASNAPRPLLQMRQTGLDEYLSSFGLPQTAGDGQVIDDEP